MLTMVLSVLHSTLGYQEDPWEELGNNAVRMALSKPQYAKLIMDAFKFIIAHEYGHFVLGHLRTSQLKRIHCLGDQTIAAFHTYRDQEFEADSYAYDLTLKSSQDLRNYSGIRRAAELIFWCFHHGKRVIEGYCDAARQRAEFSDHPQPLERIKNVRIRSGMVKSKCLETFGSDARLKAADESNEGFLDLIQSAYTSGTMNLFFRDIGRIYYSQPKELMAFINKNIEVSKI